MTATPPGVAGEQPPANRRKLTVNEARFVEHYLQTGSIPRACKLAGYTHHMTGYRMYRDPDVRAAIEARRDELLLHLGVTTDRVLAEVAACALLDPRTVFDGQGRLLPITQWPDGAAAALASMEVVSVEASEGGLGVDDPPPALTVVRKVKFVAKGDAQDKLMRHLGLYEKDNAQPAQALGESVGDRMTAAMAELAELLNARAGPAST